MEATVEHPIRLHLGAGHYHWPGFINHDDEIDLKNLPYKDESISVIYSIHMFEHLPRMEIDDFLAEWKRVLVPRGTLVMEMPSLDKIAKLITKGTTHPRLTLFGIFGDPRDWEEKPLMRHQWSWTQAELAYVLRDFEVEFQNPVYHLQQRDLRVIARKP